MLYTKGDIIAPADLKDYLTYSNNVLGLIDGKYLALEKV